MTCFRYTDQQKKYIADMFKIMRVPELTVLFNALFKLNKTTTQIKSVISKSGFVCGRKGPGKGRNMKMSIEQIDFLKTEYQNKTLVALVAELNQKFKINKTYSQIRAFVRNHKILSGRTGHFKRGHKPHPDARPKGPNKTSFKKGHAQTEIKPTGHERICTKGGHILIKTNQLNPYTRVRGWYQAKHVFLWENKNGKIPDGMVLRFKDGNKLNPAPENMMLISKALHLRLNRLGYKCMPERLQPALKNIAELEVKTFKLQQNRVTKNERKRTD